MQWETENSRIGDSILPLATNSNSMKRMRFRASPADYQRPPARESADHRTSENRHRSSRGEQSAEPHTPRASPVCGVREHFLQHLERALL